MVRLVIGTGIGPNVLKKSGEKSLSNMVIDVMAVGRTIGQRQVKQITTLVRFFKEEASRAPY